MNRLRVIPSLILWLCCQPLAYAVYNKTDTPQLYEQALIDLDGGEPGSAEIHLKNALQADPAFLAGHVLLGQTYLSQGRPVLAQKQLERGLELGADPALIFEPLAQALLSQKKFHQLLEAIYPGNFSNALNASILVNRGRAYFELAQYDQAELAFQDAAKTDPGNLAALLGQARIYLSRREFNKSQTLADQAKTTDPENAEVWYLLGSIAHAQNQFQQGLELYSQALALNPKHYQSKLSRIGIYVDTGDNQRALDELIVLQQLAPYDPQAAYMLSVAYTRINDAGASEDKGAEEQLAENKLTNTELAKAALSKARDILESIPAEVTQAHGPSLLLSGLIYFDLQEWQKTVEQLERYQNAYPAAPSTGKLLGSAYLRLNNLDKAINSLENARKTQPRDPQLLIMLGNAYLKKQKHYKAVELFSLALESDSSSPAAGKGLGLSQLGMGDTQLGLESLQRTFEQNPAATEAGVILAITLLKERRYQQAIPIAEGLLQKAPDNLILKNLLASAYISVGQSDQARELYQQLIELDPQFLPAQINLAKLDRVQGKMQDALPRLERLLQQHPKSALLMLEMARNHEQLGNPEQTLLWLEKALATDSNDTAVGSYLVNIYLQQGELKKALELSQTLSSNNPEDWQATKAVATTLIASNDPSAAQSKLKQLSLQSGYDANQLRVTAGLQLKAQDPSGAIYSLSKAIKADPSDIPTRSQYASLLLQSQRMDELEQQLDYLNTNHPSAPQTQLLKGDLLATQGKLEDALATYQRVIEKYPQTATALKIHQLYLATNRADDSIHFLQQWNQSYPQDLAVAEVLADGYLHFQQHDLARQEFERLLQQGARTSSVLNNLAKLYLRAKDPRALEFAQQAQRLDPENPAISDTLGWILVNQGDLNSGLQQLRNASVRSANNPLVLYHIGYTLNQLERYSEARQTLGKALALKFSFEGREEAQALLAQLIEKNGG